jgi:protein MPE1
MVSLPHNDSVIKSIIHIGHFINNCPTNGDKEFDKHPRIKRTTGIPRSFLKVIEQPKTAVQSGTGGVMVTPGGDLVVAEADS